jgi:hypothetical protein
VQVGEEQLRIVSASGQEVVRVDTEEMRIVSARGQRRDKDCECEWIRKS